MADEIVMKYDHEPSAEEKTLLMQFAASCGKNEVIIEVNGERQVLTVKQVDAEGRELLYG